MPSLKLFKTDQTLEAQGAVITIADGITVTVRSENSAKVRNWNSARWRKDRGLYAGGAVPGADYEDKVQIDKCVDVLVLAWDGVTEDDEVTPLACTPDNVRTAVTDAPAFRRAILAGAAEIENFRLAEVAAVIKNSGMPSTRSSATVAREA